MPKILHLNLKREYFDAIARGEKHTEYRRRTPYWRTRLEGKQFDLIKFRNGYMSDAPEMLIEFNGIRQEGSGRSAEYAIRLGSIRRIRRWSAKGRA